MGMVGYQNADSGIALAAGTIKLLPFGRKCARGGETSSEFGFLKRIDKSVRGKPAIRIVGTTVEATVFPVA